MAGKFEVSFNSPQCGWMSIGFEDGTNEFHTTTAHAPHAFALPELLTILTSLLDASAPENEYILHWNRDPEEFDFRFLRSEGNITVEIYQFPTIDRDPANRELVYAYTGDASEVCRAFAATFEQLYQDRDTDEFEFYWRQPFPHREFEEFRAKMN
jgi:hypothetical protein